MRKLALLIMILSSVSYADCYVVGEFKGVGARENNNFSFEKDGMSDQKFMVEISGQKSRVIPNDIGCTEAGFNTVVCLSEIQGKASVETWAVYPKSETAIFTKVRNGAGTFNGGLVLLGKVLGKCEK